MPYSKDSTSNHDEMYPLLPWFANDTLSSTQRDKVADHVSTCDICKEEMQLLKMLNTDLISSSESSYASNADLEGNLSSVMQRIESDQTRAVNSSSLIDKLGRSLQRISDTIGDYLKSQWVAPALVASLLFVTIGSWSLYESQQGDYSVLSSPDAPASTAQVAVQFTSATQSTDAMTLIRKQLASVDNEISIENLEPGVYTVGFKNAVSLDQLNEMLGELQAIENVTSAEIR